jgi:hypothetical protein
LETGNSGLVTLVGSEKVGILRSTRLLRGATGISVGTIGWGILFDLLPPAVSVVVEELAVVVDVPPLSSFTAVVSAPHALVTSPADRPMLSIAAASRRMGLGGWAWSSRWRCMWRSFAQGVPVSSVFVGNVFVSICSLKVVLLKILKTWAQYCGQFCAWDESRLRAG